MLLRTLWSSLLCHCQLVKCQVLLAVITNDKRKKKRVQTGVTESSAEKTCETQACNYHTPPEARDEHPHSLAAAGRRGAELTGASISFIHRGRAAAHQMTALHTDRRLRGKHQDLKSLQRKVRGKTHLFQIKSV